MNRALVKHSPPAGIAELFANPPLVGNETRAEYDLLFSAIAAAVKPADAIAWLFVRDIADLSWEIRRERSLKLQIVRSAQADIVSRRLKSPPPRPASLAFDLLLDPEDNKASRKFYLKQYKGAELWLSDPNARKKIEVELAEEGHDSSDILVVALEESANQIDAIDRRIASYELRRMSALKMIEHYNEILARRLETASSDVIEGEFTEAAE